MDMNLSSITPVISASIIDKRQEEKERKFKSYAKKNKTESNSTTDQACVYEAGHDSEDTFHGTYEKPKPKHQ
jgi:hypothetical protein